MTYAPSIHQDQTSKTRSTATAFDSSLSVPAGISRRGRGEAQTAVKEESVPARHHEMAVLHVSILAHNNQGLIKGTLEVYVSR
ncbi:hypothetical protein INR49_013739 [Caranx melampygus]|nr:hypothetical protein INR49_013739 [Caranx melampygus]